MNEHDPRCEGANDQKLLDDVAEYGWHVVKVLEDSDSPGWAYSIGLHRNFSHPEIIVFGQDVDLMHSIINSIGKDVRSGKQFQVDGKYADLIEDYLCTVRNVHPVWYEFFTGYATWFYDGVDYPVLQCFWPDFDGRYPWEENFNQDLLRAQPLLFEEEPTSARAIELLRSLKRE